MPINPNDPADFTPVRGDYRDLSPFRFWCQKVLPLVYDDSLSYYELLCKVVDYLNKTMEDVTVLENDVTGLHNAYVQLQYYVNDYFNSLDVQQEIDNKLDVMAGDGSLSQLIQPFIPGYVSEWLDYNIGPTTPAIDQSLSVSGAGADAKVTGDRLADLDEDVRATEDRLADLEYVPFRIVSFTADPSVLEHGDSRDSIDLSYRFSVAPYTAHISYGSLSVPTPNIQGTKTLTDTFDSARVFSVHGRDNGSPHNSAHEDQKTVRLDFWDKAHWGIGGESYSDYDELLLEVLQNHVLTDTLERVFTVNATSGKYIWYAFPDSFGTPEFKVGGFSGGFRNVANPQHTNAHGYATRYQVWRSDNPSLGMTKVTVQEVG